MNTFSSSTYVPFQTGANAKFVVPRKRRGSRKGILGHLERAALATFAVASALLIMSFMSLLSGCGYGKAVCKTIDMVNSACPIVVDFIGTDGGVQRVELTRDDAISLKARSDEAAARREDAGPK